MIKMAEEMKKEAVEITIMLIQMSKIAREMIKTRNCYTATKAGIHKPKRDAPVSGR
jgi:hypothetical protein